MNMANTVIVRVTQGSLRGQKLKTPTGATYYSFHAIPYAKPPVGSLRFKVSLYGIIFIEAIL
jgi:carboxylesterase type B